jgi:branched-chain amino acid transport system ATP-binding protein
VTVSGLPAHRVAGFGIGYVPQGRRLFGEMTVAENLEIGLMARGSPRAARERALALFPRLGERLAQRADTLSGGEQQMLAMARALCVEPKVLLLDEPTEGLQPSMVEAIREVTLALREAGTAVLLVEQRQEAILTLADRVVFIEMGKGVGETEGDALRAEPERLAERLGV